MIFQKHSFHSLKTVKRGKHRKYIKIQTGKYKVGTNKTIKIKVSKEMDTHNKLEQNEMNKRNIGKCEGTK